MGIAFGILAVVAAFFGNLVGSGARTMSSGPREGTTFGGYVFTAGGGVVYGLVVGLFADAGVIASAAIGLVVALCAFSLLYFYQMRFKR